MSWFAGARTRLKLLFGRRAAEARFDEEVGFHLDMETSRLMREEQLDTAEAMRRARATFGGVTRHTETLREGRGLAWLGGMSLDLRLGFRMLSKYPGLTIVGGLAMAFGIWFGAVTFQMFDTLTSGRMPFPDGDRIVRIQNVDLEANQDEDRVLYDYQLWRSARSLTDLGAYRNASVNLFGADGAAQPAVAAKVTASGFRVAPARPVLGRVIDESDERAGAAPVVVLGHDLWTRRFNADPRIVGRSVKLGTSFATVIGVMPEKYAFPVAHELWLPLRTGLSGMEPRRGQPIKVFGRLADDATMESAQAELTAFGQRLAVDHPATHAKLRPHVLPYTQLSVETGEMTVVRLLSYAFAIALVTVVCSTVALLMFARAASRETEILVRTALGASRRRIVMQLFAEALVLSGVAAVVGLALAQLALTRLGRPYVEMAMGPGMIPFWIDFNLSPATIASALALAVIGAVVAGVMPARKITRSLGARLRAGTAGGGGVSFGGVWTAVIVVQVALTVALPSVVLLVRSENQRVASYDAGFPTKEYLAVKIGLDVAPDETVTPERLAALGARLHTSLEALRARLETESDVAGVTFVDILPGEHHDYKRAEVVSATGVAPRWVASALVDPSYFDVLRTPVLSGRGFTSGDLSPDARVVVVDQSFVDLVMRGRNPVGHRVRLGETATPDPKAPPLPWYEIVGVVKDLGMSAAAMPQRWAGVYLPVPPGSRGDVQMLVHSRGDPLSIAPRVRERAMAVDPGLRLEDVTRVDQVTAPTLWINQVWMRIIIGLTGVALLLSLAGIYAVLSYIVARRTREIGVRVALGASARLVIGSIFRRPLTQVTLGVMSGIALIFFGAFGIQHTEQFRMGTPRWLTPAETAMLGSYAVLMFGVCALACLVPTARALRVQPTEALRAE